MLKSEFLDLFNQKLSLINDKEKEDIILEYGTYIDDKIASGVSEEEAVAGFGDVDELAKEILSAYKINTDSMDPLSSKADKTIGKVYAKLEGMFSKLGNLPHHIRCICTCIDFVDWKTDCGRSIMSNCVVYDFLFLCRILCDYRLYVKFMSSSICMYCDLFLCESHGQKSRTLSFTCKSCRCDG